MKWDEAVNEMKAGKYVRLPSWADEVYYYLKDNVIYWSFFNKPAQININELEAPNWKVLGVGRDWSLAYQIVFFQGVDIHEKMMVTEEQVMELKSVLIQDIKQLNLASDINIKIYDILNNRMNRRK